MSFRQRHKTQRVSTASSAGQCLSLIHISVDTDGVSRDFDLLAGDGRDLALGDHADGARAVSYTHLDVYKRQASAAARHSLCRWNVSSFVSFQMCIRDSLLGAGGLLRAGTFHWAGYWPLGQLYEPGSLRRGDGAPLAHAALDVGHDVYGRTPYVSL